MTKDILPKKKLENPKGRLQKPVWRFLSIIVAGLSVGALLYSISNMLFVIPIVTLLFFLLLWFGPIFWSWLEDIFGKRPETKWGRFSMNLAIATIIGILSEDILEIVVKGFYFATYLIQKLWQG
ncbi:MAG: hypothetical protein HN736_18375 [Anaerolineae bacterium]|jgi:hypothetical protein|nr:hypothetical protein [Anaerolineae bacterium]MBT3713416.1 hypothetical protein [Anaerolineae bacterium]MBT4311816.1 hypothetical protein [Anaerolineae bacterium]MBT4456678.1 hypothetical protein [Anaerolineae bacterium]MBT4843308.1 hypothetical protein [Anaerolineae bacterium]